MNVRARAAYNTLMPTSLARPRLGHLAGLAALALTACSGKVEMVQVPVTGLPCSTTGQALQRPLMMEAKHGTGTTRLIYGGAGTNPHPTTIDLAKGKEHALTIRFGACPDAGCREPRWLDGETKITVDTRLADARLVVGVPGEHPCQ